VNRGVGGQPPIEKKAIGGGDLSWYGKFIKDLVKARKKANKNSWIKGS